MYYILFYVAMIDIWLCYLLGLIKMKDSFLSHYLEVIWLKAKYSLFHDSISFSCWMGRQFLAEISIFK